MLRKSRRLCAADVENILRRGKNLRAMFLTAKTLHVRGGTMRIAAVVPKSVVPRAVDRNRIRRALYRATAECLSGHDERDAHIVFFLRHIPPPPWAEAFRKDVSSILRAACGA